MHRSTSSCNNESVVRIFRTCSNRTPEHEIGKNNSKRPDIASCSNKNKQSIPPHIRALLGSLGGVVEACCLQPIDVIKTRLQLDRGGTYQGILHCGSTMTKTEGVRALWKGLTPFATHLTLKYALRMGSNAVLQTAFQNGETGEISNRGRVAAGFGAGVLEALLIVTPFESFIQAMAQTKESRCGSS